MRSSFAATHRPIGLRPNTVPMGMRIMNVWNMAKDGRQRNYDRRDIPKPNGRGFQSLNRTDSRCDHWPAWEFWGK